MGFAWKGTTRATPPTTLCVSVPARTYSVSCDVRGRHRECEYRSSNLFILFKYLSKRFMFGGIVGNYAIC